MKFQYVVEITVWENGSGHGKGPTAYCTTLEDAILVREGLEKVYPAGFNVQRGKEKIDRKILVEIKPLFPDELKGGA